MSDPYQVLGLRPKASSFAVQRAYRRLVRVYPLERLATDPKAAQEFQLIAAAYHRIKEANWRLPGHRKAERYTGLDEPPTGDTPSEPPTWSDGTPIYYPTSEEIELLSGDLGPPKETRVVMKVLIGIMVLCVGYMALGGDPHGCRGPTPEIYYQQNKRPYH
jgi:curved DNA-binding protein CbpA